MQGLKPESALILQTIRREIGKTLAPELQSDRARTIAALVDEALRHLIVRDDAEPSLPQSVCGGALAGEAASIRAELDREASLPLIAFPAPERYVVSAEKVQRWLASRWPDRAGLRVRSVAQVLGGFSKDTFLLESDWDGGSEGLAIRRDNPWGSVDSVAAEEFAILSELHGLGLPVPPPLLIETDPDVLGHAFFVSRRMPGRPIPNIVDTAIDARHVDAALGLATVLGRLHALDETRLREYSPLRTGDTAETYLSRLIDRLEEDWRRFGVAPSAIVDAGIAWLRANRHPVTAPLRLVHGDAGLHNLLMDGPAIGAMLDWEFAHLGEPGEDLAYARSWIDRIMPWDRFLERYYAEGGPPEQPVTGPFFNLFYAVRHVVSTDKALGGFMASPQPQLSSLIARLRYGRHFRTEIVRLMAEREERQ